jgi:hypothetical protein
MGIVILDPTGEVATARLSLAPRVTRFTGACLGMVDNGQHSSDAVLGGFAELFVERLGVAQVIMRKKPSLSSPVPAEIVAEFVQKCDFVLCGAGV